MATRQQPASSDQRPNAADAPAATGGSDTRDATAEAPQRLSDTLDPAASIQKGRTAAAEKTDAVARGARAVAEELSRQSPTLAGYARRISAGAESIAEQVRTKSVDELVSDAERFARANPAVFAAGSLLVGFALARLMKSSGQRRVGDSRLGSTALPSAQ